MDKLTAIKIKYDDGTYSDEIPISVLSENVEWDSTHTLVDVLGSIDVDVTGTIQNQISQLFNEKVSNSDMQAYVSNEMPTYINTWLQNNVNPVGSAVIVDKSLTISGAAADAKETGNLKNEIITARYQANEVSKWIYDIYKSNTNNLLDSNSYIEGYYLGPNPYIKKNADGRISRFIPVKDIQGENITISGYQSSWGLKIIFLTDAKLDNSANITDFILNNSQRTVTVPATAVYALIGFWNPTVTNNKPDYSTMKISKGT